MTKVELPNRLIYLADLMETLSDSDDAQTLKEVRREYKMISNELYPPTKEHEIPTAKVKESRGAALEKIKELLKTPQQEYKENEKVVVCIGNVSGTPKEFTIERTDSFYESMSGVKYITARRCLFSEKQLKGYRDLERALLETGLKLCSGRKEKQQFFDEFILDYNKRLKEKK